MKEEVSRRTRGLMSLKQLRCVQVRCAVLATCGMMASGNLVVAQAQVPDDIFVMAGRSNAKIDVAQGIRDVIKASGQFNMRREVTRRCSTG